MQFPFASLFLLTMSELLLQLPRDCFIWSDSWKCQKNCYWINRKCFWWVDQAFIWTAPAVTLFIGWTSNLSSTFLCHGRYVRARSFLYFIPMEPGCILMIWVKKMLLFLLKFLTIICPWWCHQQIFWQVSDAVVDMGWFCVARVEWN